MNWSAERALREFGIKQVAKRPIPDADPRLFGTSNGLEKWIWVNRSVTSAPDRDAVLIHELAHCLLGHSADTEQRRAHRHEPEAHAVCALVVSKLGLRVSLGIPEASRYLRRKLRPVAERIIAAGL